MRVLALLLVVACGGGGGGATKARPKLPAVDEKQAEQDAKSLVVEIYDTLGRGKKDNLFSLLDDSLVVFGPRKVDALANRTDTIVAIGQVFDSKGKLAVRSGSLEVVTSPGGRSAWAFDLANIDGQAHAIIAILINSDDIWQVDAAVVAEMPARAAMKAELGKDAVVPPGAGAKTKIESGASDAVDRFRKGLLDQEVWGADLGSRSDAIVVGPVAGEIARGKKEIKKLFKKRGDSKVRAAISGDIVASTTPDGQLAWVTAPLTRVAQGEDPLPLRAFAVYEKSGNDWKLIALHESLAFDEPGSGTRFKKIVPPKEEEKPAVAEKPAKKPDKKTTEKKKKKKKKKKKVEADE
jgi:ketosteroid isomerase-like protein